MSTQGDGQEASAGSDSDEALMAALRDGREAALEPLMTRYQKDIFRFCLHYLKDVERSQELTQETFIRVYTASRRFDPSRKFKPWVLCIARNLCLNELKRRKTVPMESLEEYASSARSNSGEVLKTADDSPDALAMDTERRAWLEAALGSLGEEAREIVVLRFFERMAAKEIAEIIGSTEGAVRTKLHRILSGLRSAYQDQQEDVF